MAAADLDTAQEFQSAAEVAMLTGDFEAVMALVAPDVEVVTPLHSLEGVDALTEELSRARPADSTHVEFEHGAWKQLRNGRYLSEVRVLFKKETGELSYSRDRSFELTIQDGKVTRYEMRLAG